MLVRRAAAFAVCALCLLPSAAAAESDTRLKSALNRAMNQASGASGAYVYDLGDRKQLYARRATTGRILASNTKLFTTGAALESFGSGSRLPTQVRVERFPGSQGVLRGDLYLRGNGDPSFGSRTFTERAYGGGGATIEGLAREVRDAGVDRITGAVIGDESIFDSLRGGPDSGYGVSVWVGPLSGLSYNRGLAKEGGSAFQRYPPEFAAKQLAAALKRLGIQIGKKARVGVASIADTDVLASVDSISIPRLIKLTNTISDNFFAEMLLKRIAAIGGRQGTTARGAAQAEGFAADYGANVQLVDGSGLARGNRAAPRGVARFLRGMWRHPDWKTFYHSLAVPGEYGTLEERKTNRRCRGKTGTISGVSNLSGYCRGLSGDLIAFSFLMNGVGYDYDRARRIQDAMTQAIARYG